jgi:type IV pilus assembly protein PilO
MSRRTILVAGAAAAGLAIMWFLLLWGPQGGKLDDARERETAAQAENDGLELRLARLQAAQQEAPEMMADLDGLRRAVPDDPQLAEFILDANTAASDAGVDFISIAPGVPQAGAALPPTITLSISVSGEYFSVLDYLERLSDMPRIVVVDSLNLAPSSSENGLQELAVQVTARMFATSAPQVAAAAAATGSPVATTTTTAAPSSESEQQVTTSTSSAPSITVTPTTQESTDG